MIQKDLGVGIFKVPKASEVSVSADYFFYSPNSEFS
jgi:hypothetical protein